MNNFEKWSQRERLDKYFMATNMEQLVNFFKECTPAEPSKPLNKKKIQSPKFPGESFKLGDFFKQLLKAAEKVHSPSMKNRDLEISHYVLSDELVIKAYDIENHATGSSSVHKTIVKFNNFMCDIGYQRHLELFPNMTACHGLTSVQHKLMVEAFEGRKFIVESGMTSGMQEVKNSERKGAKLAAQTAQIVAAGARAQAAMRPHIPATSTIVANPYWTPSNDASYVAMRAPNGVYY